LLSIIGWEKEPYCRSLLLRKHLEEAALITLA